MPKRLIIAIDCDDVLIETTEYVVEAYNRIYKASVSLDRSHDPNNEQWGIDDGELLLQRFSEIQTSEEYAKLLPLEDALNAVKQLAESHELHLVTARDGSIESITEIMLNKYLPDCFTSMEHVGRERSKGEVCRQLNADMLIDDNLRNLQSALDYGLPMGGAVHFGDYLWNRTEVLPDGVVACKGWSDVIVEVNKLAGR